MSSYCLFSVVFPPDDGLNILTQIREQTVSGFKILNCSFVLRITDYHDDVVFCVQIIILCDPQQFRVAVNGLHQLDYKHRVQDLKRITQLEVLGDVHLLDVKIV